MLREYKIRDGFPRAAIGTIDLTIDEALLQDILSKNSTPLLAPAGGHPAFWRLAEFRCLQVEAR